MNFIKCAAAVGLTLALVACGGGGGSAGTPTSGGGNSPGTSTGGSGGTVDTPVVVNTDPVLIGNLVDAAGTATSSISASGYTVLSVTLTDPSGKGIPNQVISATGDATKVVFPEGSGGLTNTSGVATIKVARASLFATGADTLTVTYSYKAGSLLSYPDGSAPPTADKVVSRYIGYQLSAANITLTNLNVGASTLAAYGTRQISVQANINGVAATSTPVQVSFSANCGVVTPATASTNSQGVVQVSYSAINAGVTNDQGCSGSTVSILASTTGATPVTGNLSIDLAPATNLLFVDATPTTIFLAGSGGATQSIVRFRLVNASNAALQGQNILLELRDLAGGIPKTSFGTVGNVDAITQPTNSSGEVSVPVFSGTVPTNVSVKATLVSNDKVTTTSSVLAIASGRAVQSRVSLAIKEFAIEGANNDGISTQVTMSLADRQGNPVPDGTAINFVTEGGVMIPPVCTTGTVPGDSQCSVSIRSQNPRPANGLVSILAYAAGEEAFVDLNFDNVYTAGEPFTDLGNAFRQDAALVGNTTGPYVDGYFSVPRAGSQACVKEIPGQPNFLGRPSSCDDVWGAADVRQQAVLVFATSEAVISGTLDGGNALDFSVADGNGNSMPTGSTIEVSTGTAGCLIRSGDKTVVGNTLLPISITARFDNNTLTAGSGFGACPSGTIISVKVVTPTGTVTSREFLIPRAPLATSAGVATTLSVGAARSFTVSGGTGPYSVSSSNTGVATATVNSTTLQVSGVAAGSATVTITDNVGASVSIAVTVN
jgi:hypothetical protein